MFLSLSSLISLTELYIVFECLFFVGLRTKVPSSEIEGIDIQHIYN